MSRLPRQAALACLVVALLSQLLLPALHALVHYREQHGEVRHRHSHARSHGARHGARELAWVIERAGGAKAKAKMGGEARALRPHAHGGAAHTHEPSHEHEPAAPAPHRHDGDRPGGPHGQSSLEHFTAFFLEATPPKLAVPFRFVAKEPVLLVEGRLAQAPIVSAQPVRGPPRAS